MANVNVTYGEMESAAQRLSQGREDITAKLEELQKLVSSLVNGGYVTDQSSRQFDDAYREFSHGAKSTISGLQSMGDYLKKAAEVFRNADAELSNRLGRG
ncbi:MAG: WXG100 family type VII secretion target [Sporichthyaceae bacterium]